LASQNSDQINIAKKLKLKQKKTPVEFLKLPSVCVRRTSSESDRCDAFAGFFFGESLEIRTKSLSIFLMS